MVVGNVVAVGIVVVVVDVVVAVGLVVGVVDVVVVEVVQAEVVALARRRSRRRTAPVHPRDRERCFKRWTAGSYARRGRVARSSIRQRT